MEISSQVIIAALVSYAIEFIKGSKYFPFITAESAKVNRFVSVVLSGLSALGIHVVCSKLNHSCVFTWTDGITVLTVLWHWVSQFVYQHLIYKVAVKK